MKIEVRILFFTRAGQYEQKRIRAHTKLFWLNSNDSFLIFIFCDLKNSCTLSSFNQTENVWE